MKQAANVIKPPVSLAGARNANLVFIVFIVRYYRLLDFHVSVASFGSPKKAVGGSFVTAGCLQFVALRMR
jgi:hypothetical protein